MKYAVTNGDISVKKLAVGDVATSSILLVGDAKTIFLANFFETPPEALIVGVSLGAVTAAPFVPLVSPS